MPKPKQCVSAGEEDLPTKERIKELLHKFAKVLNQFFFIIHVVEKTHSSRLEGNVYRRACNTDCI
jgi:hypothetical protein